MWHTLRRNSLWLLAPLALTLGACDDDPATPTPAETVVDVALGVNEETGEFSTLIAALVAADLVDTLSGAGPFTVFAPTDAAFAAAGLNADNIGEVPVETLRGILLFHVAAGRLDAANVTTRTSVPMLSGSAAGIAVTAEGAFIEEARIVQTDVAASNGIIHVIDGVLLP
jgi:uncharacterized surface protein with fasciclin (FAS1) repeats